MNILAVVNKIFFLEEKRQIIDTLRYFSTGFGMFTACDEERFAQFPEKYKPGLLVI